MSDEVAAAFSEKYPKGYSDYFPDLVKYDKPDGTSFYAVTVEIPDAIYLVKIQVKTMSTALCVGMPLACNGKIMHSKPGGE